jgi:hypothetical protein
MGYNKRREYLKFTEDDEGCGGLELTHGMTWSRLFKKYPAYKGCTEDDKRSLYDSQLGALDIDKLTPKIVQNYCNKGKTYGARVNTLKAFQYLWRASNKLNLLGDNDVLDPTRKQYGGVTITKSKKILFKGHRYTNMKFKENQLERLIEGCYQLRDKHPFQIEAIMFMLYTFRRQIETTKIDYSCVGRYGDQPRKNVITMPFNITKSGVEEYVVITDRVQEVLDSLHYQRSKEQYKKYKHIKRVRKEYLREKKAFGGLLSKTKKKPETKEQKSIKEKILPKKKKDRLEELRKELGMKKGGSALKPVDKQKNPGLSKLPTQVRNKMGYMKKGGSVKQAVKTITSPKTILRNIKSKRKFGGGKK